MCGYGGILILGPFWRHVVVYRWVGVDLGELGIDLVYANHTFSTVQSCNRYCLFEMKKYLKCSKRLTKCNRDLFWRRKAQEEVKSLS